MWAPPWRSGSRSLAPDIGCFLAKLRHSWVRLSARELNPWVQRASGYTEFLWPSMSLQACFLVRYSSLDWSAVNKLCHTGMAYSAPERLRWKPTLALRHHISSDGSEQRASCWPRSAFGPADCPITSYSGWWLPGLWLSPLDSNPLLCAQTYEAAMLGATEPR